MALGNPPLNHPDPPNDPSHGADLFVIGPLGVGILAIDGGLTAGLLEAATVIVRKRFFDSNHLYGMSRHFVWSIPVVYALLFLILGLAFVVGRRLATRVLGAMVILPALLAAFPQVYALALLIVALGVSIRVVPFFENRPGLTKRILARGLPVLITIVLILAVEPLLVGHYRGWRESSRPLPAAGSPNVMLLVLDTVAADHLGLYGYGRPTSPTLDELAGRGVRFGAVRATASWTLPSHAGMFTGRWPHELSAGWLDPLDSAQPTLAKYLSERGYATAGFVANTLYCAWDSGLDRGFTTFRDFPLTPLGMLRSATLVSRSLDGVQTAAGWADEMLGVAWLAPKTQFLAWLLDSDRKDAATVNRQFEDWLNHQKPVKRPFFAFLNYLDAHYPYQIPPTGIHRFGVAPRTPREATLVLDWWRTDKKSLNPGEIAFVRDLYDDGIAHLDEQLGRLIDTLDRERTLENTWLIVVADHGESFGEHEGVFCHGMSLYQTEVHVPMVIVPPGSVQDGRLVSETVSLRDLPATIVDLLGLTENSPFPGTSLAGTLRSVAARAPGDHPGRALSEVVPNNPLDPDRVRIMVKRPYLVSLAEPDWSYIMNQETQREELFHLKNDAAEAHDLAKNPDAKEVLKRMRDASSRLINGPTAPAARLPRN